MFNSKPYLRSRLGIFFGAVLFTGIFTNCQNKPVIPDTPAISFTTNIQPIIASSCSADGCHGTINATSPSLLTYDEVMSIVTAGDAHKSKFYTVSVKNTGDDRMPKPPVAPLTDEQLKMIYLWIMQGAKNN
ncbi:MAG: hypothetical protein JST26_14060 [Bacteroidetes bacterium]|nr:hypothetical protein [Bacteroidota bacterium]